MGLKHSPQPDGAEHGIVEFLGRGKIVRADHDMGEHALMSFSHNAVRSAATPTTDIRLPRFNPRLVTRLLETLESARDGRMPFARWQP